MKKRITSIVLTICMILGMIVLPTNAQEACLSVSETSVRVGDSFTLSYTIPNSVSDVDSITIEIGFDKEKFEATEINYADISPLVRDTGHTVTQANNNGKFRGEWSSDDDTFETITTSRNLVLFEATFIVKNNAAVGNADFTVNILEIADSIAMSLCDSAGATKSNATITITAPTPDPDPTPDPEPGDDNEQGGTDVTPTENYTASLTTTTATVNNDGVSTVNVNVNVTKAFNSAKIVLEFDSALLEAPTLTVEQIMGERDVEADMQINGNTITIIDYGTEFEAGTAYTLTFDTKAGGVADFTINSAAFSTSEWAENNDLIPASETTGTKVTINHKVTVNNTVTYVAPGTTDYTIAIDPYDPVNNEYEITTSTMGGVHFEAAIVDGKIDIPEVTGELVIEYTFTANEYTVTWVPGEGVEISNKNPADGKVTHGTNVTFDVPADKAAGTDAGWYYSVSVKDASNNTITPTSSEKADGGKTYTIKGDVINSNITITVTKEELEANKVVVTINGEDITATVGGTTLTSPATVNKGSELVITLDRKPGYTYEVTINGNTAMVDSNTHTIENLDANVTVNVKKTLDTSNIAVTKYLTLDGKTMWLVKVNSAKIDGQTYYYDGASNTQSENFYWAYGAYSFLVITDTEVESVEVTADDVRDDVIANLSINNVAVKDIANGYDVNMTGTVDVNDAQLVWNMYTATYDEFSATVTVEKFLRADVDSNETVNTDDAALVIQDMN